MYVMKVKQADGTTVDIPFGPVANGITPQIDKESKHWIIGKEDTGIVAEGQDGVTPYIGEDGYWHVNGVKTEILAKGQDGVTPQVQIKDGNWCVSTEVTENGEPKWVVLGPAIPVKGEDYWTEEDKADIENGAIEHIGQIRFIENFIKLKENEETNKIYVLPDGYMHAYKENGTFKNVVMNATLDTKGRLVVDSTQYKNCCVTDFIPIEFTAPINTSSVKICIDGLKELPIKGEALNGETDYDWEKIFAIGHNSNQIIFAYDEDFSPICPLESSEIKAENNDGIWVVTIDASLHGNDVTATVAPINYIRLGILSYKGINLNEAATLQVNYNDENITDPSPITLLETGPGWENTGHTFGNRLQLYPKFANNIYELDYKGDTTCVYVLPDNYIYVYMRGYGDHYLNHLSNARSEESDDLFNGKLGFIKDHALYSDTNSNTPPTQVEKKGYFLTGWIPIETGEAEELEIYLRNCEKSYSNYTWIVFYGEEKNKPLLSKKITKESDDIYSITERMGEIKKITINLTKALPEGKELKYIRLSLKKVSNGIIEDWKEDWTDSFFSPALSFNKPFESKPTYGNSWVQTPHVFIPASYEDKIAQIDVLQSRVKTLESIVEELKQIIKIEETE